MLKDAPCLTSEEPKAILKFFVELKAIYELNLVPENMFLMRFVNLLWGVHKTWRFVGAMQSPCVEKYFPLFVREKMIRELIVFHFQERECQLREFIKEVVDAAEFLQYRASEGEILGRIWMNLHKDILVQAAFLPKPSSYRELRDIVGLIEENMAVWTERQRSDTGSSSSQMADKGSLLDNKPGGAAVEGRRSSKKGHNC